MKFLCTEHRKLGTELTAEDRSYVLSAYVHRFTGEHKPQWARGLWNGKPYPVQFTNDADWLAHTRFAVTKGGRIDEKCLFCFSTPTWPNNPELRKEGAAA